MRYVASNSWMLPSSFFLLSNKKEEKGCLFLFHGRKRGGTLGREEFFMVKGGAWRIYHMGVLVD